MKSAIEMAGSKGLTNQSSTENTTMLAYEWCFQIEERAVEFE